VPSQDPHAPSAPDPDPGSRDPHAPRTRPVDARRADLATLLAPFLAQILAPLIALFLGVAFFAAWSPASALDGAMIVASRAGAWLGPGAYLLSAIGLGTLLRRWSFASRAIGAGLGFCVLILTTHVAAMLGLLSHAPSGPEIGAGVGWIAWLIALPGLAALAWSARRAWSERTTPRAGSSATDAASQPAAGLAHSFALLASRWALPGVFAAGALLAASTCAPGTLWRSEFGAFDALSYHLQLPQEWMLGHSAAPARHNVYSFLPGAMEAAFLHVAHLSHAPWSAATHADPDAPGLLAGDGQGLRAAQALHAGTGILAAMIWARVAALCVARRMPSPAQQAKPNAERFAAGLSFSLLMLTPWVVVVGSLAYNELGLVLLSGACARVMLAPWRSSAAAKLAACLVAVFVGVACALKPTAIFMLGAPAGILLVARLWLAREGQAEIGPRAARARSVAIALALASLVGLATLAPWLIRNHAASGNPVFPFAASVFPAAGSGTGHWNSEQVARFARAHAFSGSTFDRVRLLVVPDRTDPMGPTFRGLTHPQWGCLLLLGLVASIALLVASRRDATRPIALAIPLATTLTLVAQLLAWLFATHVQSRFLLPLAGVAACAITLALASIGWDQRRGPIRALAACIAIATQFAFLVRTLATEHQGAGSALLASPDLFTGHPRAGVIPEDQRSPEHVVNDLPDDARVLTIGESTPLYFLGAFGLSQDPSRPPPRVAYATTWDTSPFLIAREGTAAPFAPDTPQPQVLRVWTRTLRERGFTHVLINFAELDRLARSNFLDPRLDPAGVAAWARSLGQPQHAWPAQGRVLFTLAK
jgi:hypothetical protein